MGIIKARESSFSPLREVQELTHRVEQLFGRWGRGSSALEAEWPSASLEWTPSVNLAENDREYRITAELPGVDKGDVLVTLQDGVLTLQGERRRDKEEKGERYHRVESYYGRFQRRFDMPADADAEKVSATFEGGMLDVHVAKLPESKKPAAREITIR